MAALPAEPLDLEQPMRCEACWWHGLTREAVVRMEDVVRCPQCGEPVVREPAPAGKE